VFSGEAIVFAPGAYNPAAPAQAGDTGWAGEGRLLAGANFAVGGWPGFFDAGLGYRLRTAGPPDEWHADLTVGLKPAPGVMLMLQDFTTVSTASANQNFPAWRSSVAEASLVVPLVDRWSIQFGLFTSVLAVKTNTERGAALSVWRTF
jgi:protein XagA